MYKEHLLKIWGGYCDLHQNGGLYSYGYEKLVFFHEIRKVSKARNTTIKNNIYKITHFNTYFFIFL